MPLNKHKGRNRIKHPKWRASSRKQSQSNPTTKTRIQNCNPLIFDLHRPSICSSVYVVHCCYCCSGGVILDGKFSWLISFAKCRCWFSLNFIQLHGFSLCFDEKKKKKTKNPACDLPNKSESNERNRDECKRQRSKITKTKRITFYLENSKANTNRTNNSTRRVWFSLLKRTKCEPHHAKSRTK